MMLAVSELICLPLKPWSTTRNNKRSPREPDSRNIIKESDARQEWELIEVVDAIRESDLESDDDRYMEDAPIVDESPLQPNEPDSLVDHFVQLIGLYGYSIDKLWQAN